MKKFFAFLLLIIFITPTQAQDKEACFPEIPGFQRTILEEVYTPNNLFDIINGAAEMFLSYDFEELAIAEYSDSSIRYIRVELYRHRNAENAFGVYAQERSPEAQFLSIGGEGYIEEGALNFWSGPFYIKLVTNDKGPHVQQALLTIANAVAVALHQESGMPTQFDVFPKEERLPHSEYYVNRDFLGYQFFDNAYVVPYKQCTMFTAYFSSEVEAQEAVKKYAKLLKDSLLTFDKPTKVKDPAIGGMLLQRCGSLIVGAIDIRDEQKAKMLISQIQNNLVKK
ncbi:MAG: hypothetical protein KBG83_01805 [Bacteroidetes bacterium]|nr:hypothetical protein [Bacteroidota bacterium]